MAGCGTAEPRSGCHASRTGEDNSPLVTMDCIDEVSLMDSDLDRIRPRVIWAQANALEIFLLRKSILIGSSLKPRAERDCE